MLWPCSSEIDDGLSLAGQYAGRGVYCVLCVNTMMRQTVKENPSLLLSHSDSKQRAAHVGDSCEDRRDQRKKKSSSQGKPHSTTTVHTASSSAYETYIRPDVVRGE